jgi:hypothetical protein
MTKKSPTRDEIARKIGDLMIEPLDPENPDPQSNGYNWGLAHAEMIFAGANVEGIKQMRNWLQDQA